MLPHAPQSTRASKLADNKELRRLQGPLGSGAKEVGSAAARLGRGLRHSGPPPTPQAPPSAGKAAKTPAAKAPAAKAPATTAKGKQQAQQGKASAAKPAAKAKRQLLDKVRGAGGAVWTPQPRPVPSRGRGAGLSASRRCRRLGVPTARPRLHPPPMRRSSTAARCTSRATQCML